MELAIFNNIKNNYSHCSSFAWWSPKHEGGKEKSGMSDVPTETIIYELKPHIIFVGLNISKRIEREFGNFHPDYSTAQDYKLRHALQNTMFWGGYMTDIIKDFEQKVSGKVIKFLRNNKDFKKENIEKFEEEIITLGCKNPIIIAFGNDSYKILQRNLKDKYRIYKVSHYSAHITKEQLRTEIEELEKQI